MILLSAALVLVALVLLLYGVIATNGVFIIWLSIAASVAAGLLLVFGILQQRRRLATAAPASTEPAVPDTTDPASAERAEATTEAAPPPDVRSTGDASTADAATGPEDAAPPAVEETALERAAAHDSAPVVAVSADPDPPPTPAIEPVGSATTPDPPPVIDQPLSPAKVAPPSDLVTAGESPPDDVDATAPLPIDGAQVLVLAGRPRYHVPGCRFLDGRNDIEVMRLDDAEAQGYTPCSVCRA